MSVIQKKITFSSVSPEDKPTILTWLEKPHVSEWFHGDGLASTIEAIENVTKGEEAFYELWVADCDKEPFAFFMTSEVADEEAGEPNNPLSKWVEKGKKMSTLDLLIGEEKYLGQGLASPLIASFIENVLHDVDIIFIDPDKENTKAIHVYETVGFKKIDEFIASWQPTPHVLMHLKRTPKSS